MPNLERLSRLADQAAVVGVGETDYPADVLGGVLLLLVLRSAALASASRLATFTLGAQDSRG